MFLASAFYFCAGERVVKRDTEREQKNKAMIIRVLAMLSIILFYFKSVVDTRLMLFKPPSDISGFRKRPLLALAHCILHVFFLSFLARLERVSGYVSRGGGTVSFLSPAL
jgi:hypothetical protein